MTQFKPRTLTTNVLKGWERTDAKNTRAVLFVHGYTGTPDETWRHPKAVQSFPELILNLGEFDVFLFGYKTTLVRGGPRIDNIARQLDAQITNHLMQYQIVLLAHSMGGLICMQYVVNRLRDAKPTPVAGLLMYGTPTTGVEWTRLAKLLPEIAGFRPGSGMFNNQLTDMEPHSVFLENLFGEWVRRVVNGGYPDLKADMRAWLPVRVVSGNDDWVVRDHSAKGVYAGIDWQNVDCDHKALVKPLSDKDDLYQHAVSFLHLVHEWKTADVLAGLRDHSDWVWRLHKTKVIRDWKFRLRFHPPGFSIAEPAFGLTGFSVIEVQECSYSVRLLDEPFYLVLALGRDAAKATRKKNIAYIHGIYLEGLSEQLTKGVGRAVRDMLVNPVQAWERLFSGPRLRIRETPSGTWHELRRGAPEILGDCLLAPYSLEGRKDLVGREVDLDVSFKSLRPDSIRMFTMEFPWLCYGCDNEVVVIDGRPSVSSHFESGLRRLEVVVSDPLGKVVVRSKDLILPGSVVQIQWEFLGKEKENK